jgi:signal transduction histidine kinase/ligand-binding sensor domain-containing protein
MALLEVRMIRARVMPATRLAVLALSCGATVSAGAASTSAPSEYIVDLWHSANGLPSDAVIDILPSRDGYLWVATRRGPVRFDGSRFQSFGSSAYDTTALCEDREGRIWVGTWGNGVRALTDGTPASTDGTPAHFTSRQGLGSDIVLSLAADPAGGLWVGLKDGGLARVEGGRVKSYRRADGLPSDTVWALEHDSANALWISTTLGLARFQGGRLEPLATVERQFEAHALAQDPTGALWVGGRGGLRVLRQGRVSAPHPAGLSAHAFVLSLQASASGLWVGTDDGLYHPDGERFRHVPLADPHANEVVRALREDREGNLWIGTRNGLFRLRQSPFRTHGRAGGLANEYVQTVMEDRAGAIWAGTHGGLHRWRDGDWTNYTTRDGLPSDRVRALHEGTRGRIWVGTQKGLAAVQDGRVTRPAFARPLSGLSVRAILEDRGGRLWVGTASGAWRMERGKLGRVTLEDRPDEAVNAIHEDARGRVWLGTSTGLHVFVDGQLRPVPGLWGDDAQERSARAITTIHEDSAGTLWIGSYRGLYSLRDGRVVSHHEGEALPQASLYHIAEDRHGYFWLSSREGLFRVLKEDLEEGAGGRRPRGQRYGRADGMKTNECTGNTQPSGWTTRDGRLLIPTIRGLLELDPERIPDNQRPPPVLVEEFLADGKPVTAGGGARLSPGVERIEVRYTAPSFVAPEKIRFRYQLEGFDHDWRDSGQQRTAVYTSLAPGSYTFRVTACNNDGVWNEGGASFAFELLPRFHQTAWFYAACLATAGVLAGSLHRLRLRHLRARFAAVLAERNRVAREVHDTLLQGFTGVVLHLVALARRAESSPIRQELDQVIDQGETCLAEARNAVWNLRVRALDRRNFSAELEGMARQVTAGTAIEVKVRVNGGLDALPLDVEENLLRIGREALTNTVKHARARHVALEVESIRGRLVLRVQDDGRGFDPGRCLSPGGGHFGLLGMRERVDQLGGELTVASRPGQGTRVVVALPLSAAS